MFVDFFFRWLFNSNLGLEKWSMTIDSNGESESSRVYVDKVYEFSQNVYLLLLSLSNQLCLFTNMIFIFVV
jgi:hypothetical protein